MSSALSSGSIVAGYRIVELVGQGATGTVYRAEDAQGSPVALKALIPELAHDDRFRQRFLRESQIAARLDDPHIVPTLDFGEADGTLYLVMGYVDGLDLREILRREGPLEPDRAVRLVGQVAAALDAAHALGLVHRDVKPGNVLVRSSETGEDAYLCDFGLAKHISSVNSLTGERAFVGTIAYISPEQIEGGTIDARADVYSLGCMLFECLTGQAPFARESELAAVYAHMNERPPRVSEVRPAVPSAFDEVVACALAKAPDDRFASCGALASASAAALRGEPLQRRPTRRRRIVLAAAGVLAAAAVTVAVMVGVAARGGGGSPAAGRLDIPPRSLGLVDTRTHAVVGNVRFTSQPWDVAFDSRNAWVLLGEQRRVARVALASRRVLSTARLPFDPGGITTGGGSAWVTENAGVGLVRIDAATGAVAQRFSIPVRGERRSSPTGVAYGAGSVWVTRGAETVRVDPRTGAVQHRFPTPLGATAVVFAQGSVWVASAENGRIVRIDPVTDRITAVTPLHGTVTDLAVERGSVWVSIVPDGIVYRLSPDDGSVLGTFSAGRWPATLTTGSGPGKGLWIADPRGRSLIRVAADGSATTVPTTGAPWAARQHGRLLWASVAAPEPVSTGDTPRTLKIPLVNDELGSADPAVTRGPVFAQLAYSTCPALLNYPDAEGARGRTLRPEVAAAPPVVSGDGRTYSFRVRPGFRFSPPSEQTVTAETFRYTIERALSPKLAQGGGPNQLGQILQGVEGASAYAAGRAAHISGITATGDTLTIRLKEPAGDLPARLRLSFFCPVPVGTPVVWGGGSDTPIPMAGPYYVSARSDGQVVVERNPNYTGDRPRRLDRIVYTTGVTATDAVARVASGNADYVNGTITGFDPAGPLAPGGSLDRRYGLGSRAGRAGRPRYVANPAPGIDAIAFNTRRSLFADARMRRAVAAALDRSTLAKLFGEQPTDRLIPPAVSGLSANVAYANEPDLTTARRLVGRARRTAVLYYCGDPVSRRVAGVIRSNLARIGVTVRIDASLGCLSGPEPRRLAAADMQLVSRFDAVVDPAGFVELPLGDSYFAPGYLSSTSLRRQIVGARRTRGAARTAAYEALDTALVRDEAAIAVYASGINPELFSERVGCRISQGALNLVDLGALCLR